MRVLFLGLSLFSALARAEPSPGPLDLPAHDVEWVRPLNESVRVGDGLELKVSGLPQPASTLAFSEGEEKLQEQGWVVEPADAGAKAAPGEFWFVATPLRKGTLTLPSLEIRAADGTAFGRSNPFSLAVQSAIAADDPKPDKPADIRPPLEIPYPTWVIAAASALGVLVLALAIYLLRRWILARRAPPPPKAAPPPTPEDTEALEALVELERRNLVSARRFKPHYFRASEILKTYLGRRYAFDALESTTSELLSALEEKEGRWERERIDAVKDLLTRMDRVKFTDHVPADTEAASLVKEVRDVVTATARKGVARHAL